MKSAWSRLVASVAAFGSLLAIVSCAPDYGRFFPGFAFFSFFPFGLVSLAVYMLPTIIAALRRKKNLLGIVLLNVLAGWTLVGWIIALVWSLTRD